MTERFTFSAILPPGAFTRWHAGVSVVDAVVYPSAYAAELLRGEFEFDDHIPSMISPNFVPNDWTLRPPDHPTSRDLITVGRLAAEKFQTFALHIIAALKQRERPTTLTIVGSGGELSRLVKLAEELEISDLVSFAGSRTDVRELLMSHRAYISTSVVETFGITVIEAMATGLPVLAAPSGALSDLVTDGVTGCHLDLDDLQRSTDVVAALLDDDDAMSHYAAAGRAEFEARFSEQVVARHLSAFLSSLP